MNWWLIETVQNLLLFCLGALVALNMSDFSSALQNLDDDANNPGSGALNGGAPPVLDDNVNEYKDHAADGLRGNDLEPSSHEPPAANISRGESFVSAAMYV